MKTRWKRNDADIQRAMELRKAGKTFQEIAAVLGCGTASIYRCIGTGSKMSIKRHDAQVHHAVGEWFCYQCKRWLCRPLFCGTSIIPKTHRCKECANYNIRAKCKTHIKPFEPRETNQ